MESFRNFHTTAKDIHVEDGHILAARLHDSRDQRDYYTSIDLNHCIGNVDGKWNQCPFTKAPMLTSAFYHRPVQVGWPELL